MRYINRLFTYLLILSKTNFRSLDFPINRFFIKLFNTSDMQIVTECQSAFNFRLPSTIIPDRCETFRAKYDSCNNSLFKSNLPCPRCNIFCFCGLNGLFGVYFVSCIRLIVLRVGSILVFVVCCFCLFVFSITRWWIKLLIILWQLCQQLLSIIFTIVM